jgi:hypothetical protein
VKGKRRSHWLRSLLGGHGWPNHFSTSRFSTRRISLQVGITHSIRTEFRSTFHRSKDVDGAATLRRCPRLGSKSCRPAASRSPLIWAASRPPQDKPTVLPGSSMRYGSIWPLGPLPARCSMAGRTGRSSTLLLPNGDDHLHNPMGPASRPALLRGAGSFPSRALDGQPCTRTAPLRLYAVRRRTAHLHRPAFRHDRSSSGADNDGAALLDGVAARSQGDAISVDHLAPPWRRMAQDQGASDAAPPARNRLPWVRRLQHCRPRNVSSRARERQEGEVGFQNLHLKVPCPKEG